MLDIKRGRGRPPKVRPEESPIPARPVAHVAAAEVDPARRQYHILEVPERFIEVEMTRKYAPEGQATEIQAVVYPGTVLKLPMAEATRVLKLGIARGTDNTFKE